MDDKAKRRLSNKTKTNHELFAVYYDHLKIKLTQNQVKQYRELLEKFHQFLGEFPPSVELATQFLAQYTNRAQNTMVRYAGIIRGFMDWYGDTLDIRPLKPKSLPEYVEPDDINKLIEAILKKRSHKETVARDILLINFAKLTGLRRSELAHLKVRDIQLKQKVVLVRQGKGSKDRAIPLLDDLVNNLSDHIKDMKPNDNVFGLTERSITDKITTWSKKTGVKLHPHSFRHYFAEQLLERGVPITVVSKLLGHENLETTARYLGLRPGSFRESVDKLAEPLDKEDNNASKNQNEIDKGRSGLKTFRIQDEKHGQNGESQTGQTLYTETPHKQTMRELSGSLQREVGLPHVLEIFLKPRFNPSALSIDQKDNHLSQGLLDHLESGGFSEVPVKIKKWKDYAEQYLAKCRDMFENIKGKIPEDEPIAYLNGEPMPGLILDPFCGTVGADVVGKETGTPTQLGYTTERHFLNPDLWVLKYGAYGIYLTLNVEELVIHQKMHEGLIVEYSSDPSIEDVATLKKHLSEIEIQINRQLQVFIDFERLPGYCRLC